jgi:membrane-bound lytic murein transglycosylase D
LCQKRDLQARVIIIAQPFINRLKSREIMRKLISITMALSFAFVANAIEKDTLAPSPFGNISPENAEVAEIDRILVQSYLNHYCFSTDKCVLNAYDYSPEHVPTFSSELVAQRMQVLDKNTPFDLVYNPTVQGFIDLYAVRRRDITSKVLGMSQLYFPMMEEQLAKYGIPLEMKYLSIVESALSPTAISRAGAGGLWQFMVATGKQYGLEVTSYQDERFDAYKSTDAACQYLRFLYDTFGDWQLALAAYNSGPGNVNKAIRRSGGKKDFWSIKPFLPKETQGYVPAFIAVNYVMNHAAEYNIYPKQPLTTFFETDTISVSGRVDFNVLSKVIDVPVDDIAFLNGTYKLKEVPDNGRKHYIVIPVSKMGVYMANEQLVYEQSKVYVAEPVLMASKDNETINTEGKAAKTVWDTDWKTHKVKKGESLGVIANKYDVSLANLKKWNNIKGSKLAVGQKIKIQTKVKRTILIEEEAPVAQKTGVAKEGTTTSNNESTEEENYQKTDEPTNKVVKPGLTKNGKAEYKYYTVQKGDTLFKIASAKGVSVEQIKKLNQGLRENKLAVGQKLKIKQI